MNPPVTTELSAIGEYVMATIAEADASAEAGIKEPGALWPKSVLEAKERLNHAYEDLFALACGQHTPRCAVWYELDDVTGTVHALGTCDCILASKEVSEPDAAVLGDTEGRSSRDGASRSDGRGAGPPDEAIIRQTSGSLTSPDLDELPAFALLREALHEGANHGETPEVRAWCALALAENAVEEPIPVAKSWDEVHAGIAADNRRGPKEAPHNSSVWDRLRERAERAESEADRAWAVLDWLAANMPQALELCPYKATR